MKFWKSPARDEWRVDLIQAPTVEVKSWGHKRLRYRVTSIIVVHLLDGTDYLAMYGVRVRRDGVSFGRSVPVSGNYREVTTL
jgi:hypothetical protein